MNTLPEVSIAEVMRHVHHMSTQTPFRKSGTAQDKQAAEYVVAQMRQFGLDAKVETFEVYDSDPGTVSLEIVGPNAIKLDARACAHVEPTPPGGYTAELVDVGPGAIANYEGKDVKGKIVLAEVSYSPATPEKARIAASMGAAGIILMNWGRGDEPGMPWRGLKAVWGNPTPETWNQIPRLFGASISRRDGERLRELLAKGPVTLKAEVTAARDWREVYQPIAWLRAPETVAERDKFVIVSGHLDSWDPGVTDNITGDAVMLEVARALAGMRDRLRRSVVFCFWNGHEVAEAAGSTYFVDDNWEAINTDAVAYLNIDSVGMKGTGLFNISSCPELAQFVETCAQRSLGDSMPIHVSNLERIGDQSFFGVGVAAATGRHGFTPEVVAEYNGATLGWYNHTEFDTIEVLDEAILARDLAYWNDVITTLSTMAVLPHRFTPRIDDMAGRMKAMFEGLPADDITGLGRIAEGIERLRPLVKWFDSHLDGLDAGADGLARANRVITRLSRQLTFITGSASGKYEQDSYGISTLKLPVPFLSALEDYRRAERDSDAWHLFVTRLQRDRHVVTDALQAATDILVDFQDWTQVRA